MPAINTIKTAERRLGTKTSALLRSPHITAPRRRATTFIQTRNVAAVPGKGPNNMGGPGGQEHFPESAALRRRYAMTTMYGVLAACSILVAARVARFQSAADANAGYVLVHDSTKGELDDVKYVKASELPKS
ncbi:hypothetical protein C8A00DRAFT_16981 [Chaetomidium leptoderma]|uniref:Uncharacterized protein n=1 Tax=Chaetomidium leptoderma TaxID=669021 RepID=A0AAN6VHK1_9PEZI|nr:hypothetical protein C8A00DRAFT_16981 [Chaetomidium leptoderma]